jgi:hypothetical protein
MRETSWMEDRQKIVITENMGHEEITSTRECMTIILSCKSFSFTISLAC